MRILVTGASGFVGSAAASHLINLGHEVVRWFGPGSSVIAESNAFSVDISNESTFPDETESGSLDAVVHSAGIAHRFGRTSLDMLDQVNVRGTQNVARYAARCGASRLVLLSSVLVYGRPKSSEPITEGFSLEPMDHYGDSKLSSEIAAKSICEQTGIELTILRPVPIIGEGSKGNVERLIQAIDRGRFLWVGDGRNYRSFVYVDDVAGAIAMLLTSEGNGGTYNVAGGSVKVKELVELISDRLKRSIPNISVPTWSAKALYRGTKLLRPISSVDRYRRTLDSWLIDAVYSGDAIRRAIGFVPQTTIEEAINREVDFYLRTK